MATKLSITVTKTSRGDQNYAQIMSEDQTTLNIVLIADIIEVQDYREKEDADKKKRP